MLSPTCVVLQVTKGTVDEGIYAMAERKLRLDAAVLDGVTATGDGKSSGANVETAQVLLAPAGSYLHAPLHWSCRHWMCCLKTRMGFLLDLDHGLSVLWARDVHDLRAACYADERTLAEPAVQPRQVRHVSIWSTASAREGNFRARFLDQFTDGTVGEPLCWRVFRGYHTPGQVTQGQAYRWQHKQYVERMKRICIRSCQMTGIA